MEAGAPGGFGRRIAYRLPGELRQPLVSGFKAQREAVRAAAEAGRAVFDLARHAARRSGEAAGARGRAPATGVPFGTQATAGDVLLAPGSPWFHPFYHRLAARARQEQRLRLAVLVYDAIPLIRPEWCEENLVRRFTGWARTTLPLADTILTISRASGNDLRAWAAREGVALRAPPEAIPVGTGFTGDGDEGAAAAVPRKRSPRLPAPGSYVLSVSTLEARKNHALLFRVWRHLLDERGPDRVPVLVLAGRIGWMVADLVQQIRQTNGLGGRILLIADASDAELRQLYEGCRFTVFPSFYEGWGLPVTESLGQGRPCIASGSSAVPEAGGALARYFDPENGTEALAAIRSALDDPAGTDAWAERIRREFRPVPWADSARRLVALLDHAQA
ncbi:glycosyltransferase family 4 protein [Acetobacteraceae bacterium KSS12]|uniref:Glycosyltransferase family 4 protein n=2 Tax=Rhizosaccharibacter radicis TaxID=2782605 RepID=A0ABT1VT35_9PROT|nr:glycosyltransferase family 4 protein [Acetobacteraceae bacterium KSS12]